MPEINFEIQVEQKTIRASVNVPEEAVRPVDLLPIIQGFSSAVIGAAADGLPVTCHRGCAACCRQLVPVSVTEAIALIELIGKMAPEIRAKVMAGFETAIAKVTDGGILEYFKPGELTNIAISREVALKYFELRIDCPFLENEACLIHAQRPLSCREYLAVSPPENCWKPAEDKVETVILPKKLSYILYRFGDGVGDDDTKVIALPLLFDYLFPEQPKLPGTKLFENFFVAFRDQAL
jgi:Fe-S-cluster containining protein